MDLVFVAGDGADQVANCFPIVAALAGRLDRAVEALEAAREVDHRAAFFGESGGRQHEMRARCGRVGECVKLHQEIELREVVGAESCVADEIFAEHDEGLDFARADGAADRIELGAWVVVFPNQLRAGGVRVAIGGDEQVVGFAGSWDDREVLGADVFRKRAGEEELLIGHATGGDDGDLIGREALDRRGGACECGAPCRRLVKAGGIFCERLREAVFTVDVVEIEAV